MMSRKDYVAMAEAMSYCEPEARYKAKRKQWVTCCKAMADVFKRDNFCFEYCRFYKACGMIECKDY